MKKLIALLVVLTMVLSLAACGGGGEASNDPPKETDAPKTTETPKQTDAPKETDPVNEVVELTMVGVDNAKGADWNNTLAFAEYEKRKQEFVRFNAESGLNLPILDFAPSSLSTCQ